MVSSWFLCLLFFIVGCYGTTKQSTIRYTVENQITNNELEFQEYQDLEPAGRVFIDIMDEAAENDETFRYLSTDYGDPLGEYVYEINGLPESRPDQTYWALLKREVPDVGECLIPTGVSYFVPEVEDHIVFAYLTYDMSAEIPSCESADKEH